MLFRRKRERKESSDGERSSAVVDGMPVRDQQKPPLQNNCSDTKSELVNDATSLTIEQSIAKIPVNKKSVTFDVSTPTETTDDDTHASGPDRKVVVRNPSHNSENTYAQIDKTRKDFKRKEMSKYEQVLGFGSRIDRVENLTGSDTFMCENDLYCKVTLEPQKSKISEIETETVNVDMNDISDGKTEKKCECMDSNGSLKDEMREELNENTDTQLEKHNSSLTTIDNNDGNNATEQAEIANKDDSSDEILDQLNVQEKPTEKSRVCAVNSETIMTENMDIYSDAQRTTGNNEF